MCIRDRKSYFSAKTLSKLNDATELINERANSSLFCGYVTNYVSALNILTLLFPEVTTEKVSAFRLAISISVASVSYTHLDVYKRQVLYSTLFPYPY